MTPACDIVLHIPSLQGGGAERVAVDLARYFIGRNRRVVLFVHHPGCAYDLPDGVEVRVARSRRHLQRVLEFRALLRHVKAAAVISFLPYANLVSLFANPGAYGPTRLVVSEHRLYAEAKPVGIAERIKHALLTALYPRSDVLVAVSQAVADELRQRLRAKALTNIVVIHNPCHAPQAPVSRFVRAGALPTVLSVGRLVAEKGFDTLIAAFALAVRETRARLRIVGEGPDRARLEAMVARLGLAGRVTLQGFTRDMDCEYRNADLLVCASRSEGFGNVIVEALSHGLPVVSTRCGGVEEILGQGRHGTLVPIDDAAALGEAIVRVLGQPVNPDAQIARARDFSLEVIGARYLEAAGLTS